MQNRIKKKKLKSVKTYLISDAKILEGVYLKYRHLQFSSTEHGLSHQASREGFLRGCTSQLWVIHLQRSHLWQGRMRTPGHLQGVEVGFLKKFPKLACQKCHPALWVLRTESPTHLDHSWQVEHRDPHLWVGFSEFVGQGASTPCWDQQFGTELFSRREH